MWVLRVNFTIFIISSAIITTSGKAEEPVECLELESNYRISGFLRITDLEQILSKSWCKPQSKLCCQENEIGNSSSPVKRIHCDYLGRRVCLEADQIYRYEDVLVIETLKDDYEFNFYYDKYVSFLRKIEERLVLKPFMDRMYASPYPRRNYGYGKM
nr:Cys-motif [Cotesia vestalis bracovirus]